MRIVVSGSHASGKSTLISDFTARHPGFESHGDPFELLDEAEAPGEASFRAQLRIAAARLPRRAPDAGLIAERGPLDFLAYLTALQRLGRGSASTSDVELTASAMLHVELLVLLPLDATSLRWAGPDEDLELRAAMDECLLGLVDDGEVLDPSLRIIELTGSREHRLALLEDELGR